MSQETDKKTPTTPDLEPTKDATGGHGHHHGGNKGLPTNPV